MNFQGLIGQTRTTLTKYSPEILLGVGIVGVVGATYLACKATLKCEATIDRHQTKMDKIEEAARLAELGEVEYTEEEIAKDRYIVKVQTTVDFIMLYGPAVTLMGASIGCILGAHRIMSRRQVALVAAYKVIEEAFSEYRRRVVDELGEVKDAHFRYGTTTVEEINMVEGEDGKKHKVKSETEAIDTTRKLTGFARIFEKMIPDPSGLSWTGSSQWSSIHDYNMLFLQSKEQYFNDMLQTKGFITMNDVYDELGFPRTESGMISGWRWKDGVGDSYISFRPRGIDGNWTFGINGDYILLDFNIDGIIFDNAVAKSEW